MRTTQRSEEHAAHGSAGADESDGVRGGRTVTAPSYLELERAIASVPGVTAADVTVVPETGRARLKIRLVSGEDPEAVAWAVAATLRERFGIALDPDDIRARTSVEPAPAEPEDTEPETRQPEEPERGDDALLAAMRKATPEEAELPAATNGRRRRPVIQDLVVRRSPEEVASAATLRLGGRHVRAEATGVATAAGVHRSVAEATISAVSALCDPQLVAGIEDVAVMPGGDPPVARVVVDVVSPQGERRLVGAAIVRGDVERAVMRATLDAINRWIEPLLASAGR